MDDLMIDRAAPTVLKSGEHETPAAGMCLTEAVAWIAGEPHSDEPECCCRVLTAFGREWNDGMRSDEERSMLLKWVPQLVGTRASEQVERRRAEMAQEWLARECAPEWLAAAGMTEHAEKLRNMDGLHRPTLFAARDAAEVTAMDIMGSFPWDASGSAASASACHAAEDAAASAPRKSVTAAAAVAAVRAADVAAAVAARDAASGDIASELARKKLEPTVARLQDSAEQLLRRMIDAGKE